MAYDEALAERVRKLLGRRKGYEEKKMFGGAGFLLHGNMCVGIWKDSLVVRFNREFHEETLGRAHVKPFDITGKVMRGWALIAPSGLEGDDDLESWVTLAEQYVASLPRK